MSMKKTSTKNPSMSVFTVLRVAAMAAGVIGTLLALWLSVAGVSGLTYGIQERQADMIAACVTGLATVLAVSMACWRALIVFMRMVGRLKMGSAFTEENAQAMRNIAAMMAVCGAALLTALVVLTVICCAQLPFMLLVLGLLGLAFWGVGLLAYALGLLVRRAADIQQENDLTI